LLSAQNGEHIVLHILKVKLKKATKCKKKAFRIEMSSELDGLLQRSRFGTTVTIQNYIHEEDKVNANSKNTCCHSGTSFT
jgi:hypothetical protein